MGKFDGKTAEANVENALISAFHGITHSNALF